MRFFVFVDDVEGYVDDPVEADSLEEAHALVAARLRPGSETVIYLAPMSAVERVCVEGPRPEPRGLLALLEESNRLRAERTEAMRAVFGATEPGTSSIRLSPKEGARHEEARNPNRGGASRRLRRTDPRGPR